jgi:hypothetical protein
MFGKTDRRRPRRRKVYGGGYTSSDRDVSTFRPPPPGPGPGVSRREKQADADKK